MIFTLDGRLRLTDCPAALRRALMEELTIPNPAYTRAAYLGLPTYSIPRELLLYEVQSNELILPRGMANDVWHRRPKDTQKRDAMTLCPAPAWPPGSIRLRSYQQKAADAVLASKTPQGVLVMPCGAGKTETGLYLIRAIGQPALWIAHTNDLVLQAAERAKARLGLTDGQIGILNGTQKRIGTHLTVATVQTLYHMELDDLAGRIGTVIVDECQHVVANPANAQMFNAVLGCLPARYRYGLTATPARGDGLEHTIHMILGDTIAQVDQQVLVDTGSTVIPKVQPVLTQFSYTPGPREQMHIDTARLRRCLAVPGSRLHRLTGFPGLLSRFGAGRTLFHFPARFDGLGSANGAGFSLLGPCPCRAVLVRHTASLAGLWGPGGFNRACMRYRFPCTVALCCFATGLRRFGPLPPLPGRAFRQLSSTSVGQFGHPFSSAYQLIRAFFPSIRRTGICSVLPANNLLFPGPRRLSGLQPRRFHHGLGNTGGIRCFRLSSSRLLFDLFHPYQFLLSSCHSSDFQIGKSKSPLASGGCLCYHKGKL